MGNPSAYFEVPEINLISMEFDKMPTWKSPTIILQSIVGIGFPYPRAVRLKTYLA